MSKAQKKKTTASNLPVPQTRADAANALARIGELDRKVARIEADMNDCIAALKNTAEGEAEPLRNEATALFEGLKVWCEAHRAELTANGKVKTADLGTGTVSWRSRPPKVTLRDVDTVIMQIKMRELLQFLRTAEEVNKDAMRDDPALARTIAGVTVGSAGEDFVAEAFEAQLSEAAQ